jgi:hypothetical protein
VDDELDAFACNHDNLEQAPCLVGTDQHDEIITLEDSDEVAVSVEHVNVTNPVFAGARQDHRVDSINLA